MPWNFHPQRLVAGGIYLACVLLGIAARAQTVSTLAEAELRLKNKPLFLRGCWKDDKLSFDHNGELTKSSARVPFSLCGVDVEQVTLQGEEMKIRGQRIGLEYNKAGVPRRVVLGSDYAKEHVEIKIAGHAGEDFEPALGLIFAPDLATLVPSMPAYWQRLSQEFIRRHLAPGETADVESHPIQPPGGIAPAVSGIEQPPVLLHGGTPKFSEAAHLLGYSGMVGVHLWVEPSGLPSDLQVTQPAGLGLDEIAISAVAGYRFRPARRNGVPVRVELFVSVKFDQF